MKETKGLRCGLDPEIAFHVCISSLFVYLHAFRVKRLLFKLLFMLLFINSNPNLLTFQPFYQQISLLSNFFLLKMSFMVLFTYLKIILL